MIITLTSYMKKDQEDEIVFNSMSDNKSVVITMDDLQFRINEDILIIDSKEVKCLYVNFLDQRGADRLHILPASGNALHLTGGR